VDELHQAEDVFQGRHSELVAAAKQLRGALAQEVAQTADGVVQQVLVGLHAEVLEDGQLELGVGVVAGGERGQAGCRQSQHGPADGAEVQEVGGVYRLLLLVQQQVQNVESFFEEEL
jgi:hypothetical protein